MKSFAALLAAVALIPAAAGAGYVLNTDPAPLTIEQAMKATLLPVKSMNTEGYSFVPTSGPFEGVRGTLEDVFNVPLAQLQAAGVDPVNGGDWTFQSCHYYSTKGTESTDTNPVQSVICRSRKATYDEAKKAWETTGLPAPQPGPSVSVS